MMTNTQIPALNLNIGGRKIVHSAQVADNPEKETNYIAHNVIYAFSSGISEKSSNEISVGHCSNILF